MITDLPPARRSPDLARTLELDALAAEIDAAEGWVELDRVDKALCLSSRLRNRWQGLDRRGIDLAVRTDHETGVRILWARSPR